MACKQSVVFCFVIIVFSILLSTGISSTSSAIYKILPKRYMAFKVYWHKLFVKRSQGYYHFVTLKRFYLSSNFRAHNISISPHFLGILTRAYIVNFSVVIFADYFYTVFTVNNLNFSISYQLLVVFEIKSLHVS